MTVSIVIPTYKNYHLTHSLLLNIYKLLPKDCEIILVDDCSKMEEVSAGLIWWRGLFGDRFRVFENEVNCGFLRTANFGVSRASNDVVMLVSNDVSILDKDIVSKVEKALEHPNMLVGAKLYTNDTGWNTFNGIVFPYLEGWFLAFRKEEWMSFGGFDLRYAPYDFEDVDISTTYRLSGGDLVEIDSNMVHLGAQTIKYSPEREAQTKTNQKKFEDKWIK